jgi:sRNA-binding regulator protein Hfq
MKSQPYDAVIRQDQLNHGKQMMNNEINVEPRKVLSAKKKFVNPAVRKISGHEMELNRAASAKNNVCIWMEDGAVISGRIIECDRFAIKVQQAENHYWIFKSNIQKFCILVEGKND